MARMDNHLNAMPVWLAPAPPGAGFRAINISKSGDEVLKEGDGILAGICINTGDAGGKAVFSDGDSNPIGTFSLEQQRVLDFPGSGIPFSGGLMVQVTGNADITIVLL